MEKKVGLSVDPSTMNESLAVPTMFVNRFIVSTGPNHFRFAFGEAVDAGSPVHARCAVAMSPYEAYELKGILENLLVPFMDSISAVKGEAEAVGDVISE